MVETITCQTYVGSYVNSFVDKRNICFVIDPIEKKGVAKYYMYNDKDMPPALLTAIMMCESRNISKEVIELENETIYSVRVHISQKSVNYYLKLAEDCISIPNDNVQLIIDSNNNRSPFTISPTVTNIEHNFNF